VAVKFIDDNREESGVETICATLQVATSLLRSQEPAIIGAGVV